MEQITPPTPMDEYQLKILIKRFFIHKDKGVRQTDNLRNVATRAYLIGYEQALKDLEEDLQKDSKTE